MEYILNPYISNFEQDQTKVKLNGSFIFPEPRYHNEKILECVPNIQRKKF